MLELNSVPHRRFNPLTGEWVLVSPHRTQRPWQGQMDPVTRETKPEYDPNCYLCPGNARSGGKKNPHYSQTFVFDNDFPSLYSNVPELKLEKDGLLHAESEPGIGRVICFSPRHDLSLANMPQAAIRNVVDVWAEQYAELGVRDYIGHVQIFENKGEAMGASNPHPHCQIWAQRSVPHIAQREAERFREYFDINKRTLLGDYINIELGKKERLVYSNDGFAVVVPFWAVWPFETLVVSRRAVPSLVDLSEPDRDHLADALKYLTATYDALFDVPFPYSAGVHQAATDGSSTAGYHMHMHFYPPLLRSATVRKFLVGYEMLGEPQRDITAESAAERLREAGQRIK